MSTHPPDKQDRAFILVSGASGLIGSALVQRLRNQRHRVKTLVRRKPANDNEIRWDIGRQEIESSKLEGCTLCIHLAGESIAGRWNSAKKQRIADSRIKSTTLLAKSLAELETPPSRFISASAVGFYGDRGEEELDEDSPPGNDFLAQVSQDWEAASQVLESTCTTQGQAVKRVFLRTGVVLSPKGGALKQMLPAFRFGLGGRLGSGDQFIPWITLNDHLRAIEFLIERPELEGAFNLCGPNPSTNQNFVRALGHALRRPTVLPAPAFALRLALGEMAGPLLLSSTRALPKRLLEYGFKFEQPELTEALEQVLNNSK